MKKLPSLRDVDADSITLQLAVKDAGGKDELVPLDSMDTIDEALAKALGGAIKPTDKLRIVVGVAAPAAPAAAKDGACGRPTQCGVCATAQSLPPRFESAGNMRALVRFPLSRSRLALSSPASSPTRLPRRHPAHWCNGR